MQWPAHFPGGCPPDDAFSHTGDIYRFVDGVPPADLDFESWFQKFPRTDWGQRKCQACGLSIYVNQTACENAQKVVPSLRAKKIAKALIGPADGVIKNTKSNASKDHHTWWVPTGITNIHLRFANV